MAVLRLGVLSSHGGSNLQAIIDACKEGRHISKLKIREMGSRYLFIVLYCFIERYLSRGDYLPKSSEPNPVLRKTTAP